MPGVPLRIEAAAYRGRPVFFDTIGPWTRPAMMRAYKPSSSEKVSRVAWALVLVATLCVGAYLARRNLRLGRGDRRGAFRFAAAVFAISVASWIFGGTHVAASAEIGLVIMRVGWSLFLAGVVWMVYLAVEPYVRKYWPGVLIGWSRLRAGRWRIRSWAATSSWAWSSRRWPHPSPRCRGWFRACCGLRRRRHSSKATSR